MWTEPVQGAERREKPFRSLRSLPSFVSFLSPLAPVCPPSLLARARALSAGKGDKARLRIALAGGESETALEGARAISDAGLAEVLVLGDADKARAVAKRHNIALEEDKGAQGTKGRGGITLLDCPSDAASARAASMAHAGEVQIVMKGSMKTDAFMRALLTRDGGIRIVGQRMVHVFSVRKLAVFRLGYLTISL